MLFGGYILLTLAALLLAGAVSTARGRTLWAALLVMGWVIGQLNTLIEAVVFAVLPIRFALLQLGISLVVLAVLAALAVTLLGRWKQRPEVPATLDASIRKLIVIILAYELLYWSAGTMVWPFVQNFYSTKGLPPTIEVAALQVPRALVFVAAAWPWLRTAPAKAPLVLGFAFAVIAGIAPMLPDNPFMPADIRFAHAIETSVSNFLFGFLIAWLLRPNISVAGKAAEATS